VCGPAARHGCDSVRSGCEGGRPVQRPVEEARRVRGEESTVRRAMGVSLGDGWSGVWQFEGGEGPRPVLSSRAPLTVHALTGCTPDNQLVTSLGRCRCAQQICLHNSKD
jgi:hypothetical protein